MLYLLPTPLGNLRDITLRTLEVLSVADVILCEDTRIAKKLLMLLSRDAFIAANFPNINEQKPIFCLHSHNEKTFLQDEVFAKLQIDLQNQTVIYMSDAGMPCISDPGTKLIEYARDRGIRYDVVPGGSAVTLAYAMSGMDGDGFIFGGFLPHKREERRKCLMEFFERLDMDKKIRVVFYESPHRILDSLRDIAFVDSKCQVFAIKEMTKLNQKFFQGRVDRVLEELGSQNIQGEWVLVLKPQERSKEVLGLSEIRQMDIPPKIKAKLIAKISNEDVKTIYQEIINGK